MKISRGGVQSDNVSPSEKPENLNKLLDICPKNQTICDNIIRAWSIINNPKHNKILCSISGGSDSDIMLDIVWKCDCYNKVDYVWFDTGIEYQATKNHLKYLENRYRITIQRHKPKKTVPLSCEQYGLPFHSKYTSEMISRLQKHGFQWEDGSFAELIQKYSGCQSALQWWCRDKLSPSLNITKKLKQFIIINPPKFNISSNCCKFAKKNVAHDIVKQGNYDLSIIGIRKAEGGIRSFKYKNCYDEIEEGCNVYRPIFWYTDSDKTEYKKHFNIMYSDCYTVYGLKRTGCVGCPFSSKFEEELEVVKIYEPKLYKAVVNIFKESYEYMREYRNFKKRNE